MTQFSLWFAYYDSLFLNSYPRLSHNFYMDHVLKNIYWPKSVCPTLTEIYRILQNFIKNQHNWKVSGCQELELSAIQRDIDDLMHFLELQKNYAYSFWHLDLRRVQASILHFYTFMQLFIRALIPYPTMTLFQCKTANKLCIKIENLQKFVNQILKNINQLAKFLSNQKFRQQQKLIRNFFQNWIVFMKKLPKIKRNKLNHVHKLVKFISLTNPIQICSLPQDLKHEDQIRKKSNTVGTKIQIKIPEFIKHRSNIKLIDNDQFPQVQKNRSFSCHTLSNNKLLQELNITLKKSRVILFKFPQQIKRYCKQTQIRNKKISFQSLSTLQNKIETISKIRTLTTTQTRRFTRMQTQNSSPSEKKRQKAMSYYRRRTPSRSTGKRLSNISVKSGSKGQKTNFYQQQSQRNEQILSIRSSKQSTIRKRQQSIMTVVSKKNKQTHYLNQQLLGLNIKKVSIVSGNIHKSSKWDIVRAYIMQRIKLRKIQKLVSLV